MSITLNWEVGTIRWGGSHQKYGDPYELIINIQKRNNVAFLYGGCGKFPKEAVNELIQKLKDEGFTEIEWERAKNGKIVVKKLKIGEQ